MNRREQVNSAVARYSNDVRFTTAMVIDELNRIYGVRADDDEWASWQWIRSVVGLADCVAFDGGQVSLWNKRTWTHVPSKRTRRQFRNLCEALGVELREVQGG